MRVAIVTESFLPQVNGVTNSVRHVANRLVERGHDVLLVAPGHGPRAHRTASGVVVPVVRVRAVGLPGYRSFPVALPDAGVERALAAYGPDLVHLASPIALGAQGLRAARKLGVPTVAVYQTDVAGFARQYGVRADLAVSGWVGRLHRRCDRTLVPSRASHDQLAALGVGDLHLWRRGVSLDLFDATHRSEDLRASWGLLPGELAIGYVGRLAAEKQVRRLRAVSDLTGTRVVVVGDGPERAWLERNLPGAVFTGMLGGTDLARAFASLDVFVHTGEAETFCQTVQEAQASGVPVVAPAVGGPKDLVRHGRTGLLFRPGDTGSLQAEVARYLIDPALRARVAETARREVGLRTWSAVVDALVDVHYAAVLGAVATKAAA